MDHSLFLLPPDKIAWSEIKSFLAQGLEETSVLEYTQVRSGNDLRGILESICAMANTDGGIILIGVSESRGRPNRPGNITGMDRRFVDSLKNSCRSSLQPAFVPEMISVDIPDDTSRVVLLVRIDPERCPRPVVKRQEGPRVRVDNGNQFADLYRLQQLFTEKGRGLGISVPNIGFSPDSFLTLSEPYDLLIRCCLVGTGSSSTGFSSTVKARVKDFLDESECPLQQLMFRYGYGVDWEYASPGTSNLLTLMGKKAIAPKRHPGMASQSIEIGARMHVSQPNVRQGGALVLDTWIKRLADQGPQARWYPLQLPTFYDFVVTGLATITDPSWNEEFAEVSSFWPNELKGYVHAQSIPWLDFAGWHCVEGQRPDWGSQARADFSELNRLEFLDRITKDWIVTLFADHGCIDYEMSIESLHLPAYLQS